MNSIADIIFNLGSTQAPNNQSSQESETKTGEQKKKICAFCVKDSPNALTCGRCMIVRYCGTICQKKHWEIHKLICKAPETSHLTITTRDKQGDTKSIESTYKIFDSESLSQKNTKNVGFSALKPSILEQIDGANFLKLNLANMVSFLTEYALGKIDLSNCTGLKNQGDEALDHFFKTENYKELLKLIWSEKDLEYALEWLKKYASQGHVILMYETARLLGQMSNNKQDRILEAFRWRTLARIHTFLDSACYQDISVRDSANELQGLYSLEQLLNPFSPKKQKELIAAISTYNQQILEIKITEQLPSPRWLQFYGLDCYAGKNSLVSENEWLKRRQDRQKEMQTSLKK